MLGCLAIPNTSSAPAAAAEAPELPEEASATLDRQLRAEQLAVANRLLERFPDSDDATYLVGLIHDDQGDKRTAVQLWRRSLQLDKSRADAHHSIGYASLLQEDYPEAVRHLRQAVELDAGNAEYRVRLAHALLLQGEFEAVVETLGRDPLPFPMALRLRGQAQQQLGNLTEAKADYEAALGLQPTFAEACFGLAAVCARLGETDQAKEYRRRFNALKSEEQVRGRRARSDFDPLAVTRRSVARTHTDVARVYLAMNRPDAAVELWRRAGEIDPADIRSRSFLLEAYQQEGRDREALEIANALIRIEPDNGRHRLSQGNLLARLGRFEEAETAYREVIRLLPDRSEGYFALAQLTLRAPARAEEAETLARAALARARQAPNYFVLARALAAQRKFPAAHAAATLACELDPANQGFRRFREALATRIPEIAR